MRTAWGYDVSQALPPLLSEGEFNQMTGGAFMGNMRVKSALKAASQVIRNYCGWHISPSVTCSAKPEGDGIIKRLQAGYVSEIVSVTDGGAELTESDYEWRSDGLVKRAYPKSWAKGWNGTEIVYKAGYDIDAVPDLAEAIAAITAGVLSVSAGVASESADGVSISYSASASSIAASLTAQQKSVLEFYKVVNSHAA